MRTKLSVCLALAFVLSAAAEASARNYIAGPAPAPKKKGERRTEINFGLLVGGSDVGDINGTGVGLNLNLGRRFGDLVALGEYNHQTVGKRGTRGRMNRLGLTLRYSLLRLGLKKKRDPMGVDWFAELGAGRQYIAWNEGGRLARNDVQLGFGMQMMGRVKRADKYRYVGPYFAFRARAARAPKSANVMPTCAGPCDKPTGPPRTDVSLFFHVGMNFGR